MIQSAVALPTKSTSGQERHIRLILAFGREEPGCNAGQDNDDEADEYAPAKQSKQLATIIPLGYIPAQSDSSIVNIPAGHLGYLIEQSEELDSSSKVHEFMCLVDVKSSRPRLAWHLWSSHVI